MRDVDVRESCHGGLQALGGYRSGLGEGKGDVLAVDVAFVCVEVLLGNSAKPREGVPILKSLSLILDGVVCVGYAD